MKLSSQIARITATGICQNVYLSMPNQDLVLEGTIISDRRNSFNETGDILSSNLRYSRDSRETFVRLSHDVRQNIV